MANPQSQTGDSLAGRTTTQPTRPFGQAASGEKDLLAELTPIAPLPKPYERAVARLPDRPPVKPDEPPKAAAPERPAPSVTIRSTSGAPLEPAGAAATRVLTPKSTEPSTPRSFTTPLEEHPLAEISAAAREKRPADPRDWGLAPVQKRSSLISKFATGVALITITAGCYYGYQLLLSPESDQATQNDGKKRTAVVGDADDDRPADDEIPSLDDPFDDPETVSRRTPPRQVQHVAEALPIDDEAGVPRIRAGRATASSDDTVPTLDIPTEASGAEIEQSEPDLEDEPQPLMRAPGSKKRRRSASARSADPMEGFDHADERPARRAGNRTGGPVISIVDVDDEQAEQDESEQMEGFETDDAAPRRAAGKTVIVRSANAPPLPPAADDEWTVDDSKHTARRTAGDETDDEATDDEAMRADEEPRLIEPRRASGRPLPARAENSALRAGPGTKPGTPVSARPTAPRGENYIVAPGDNFWAISRKQYGTGRYFAALARHNQDRISDPQRLRPGMQVTTPAAADLEARYPELIDKSSAAAPAGREPAPVADGRPRFAKPSFGSPEPETAARSAPAASGYFYGKAGQPLYRVGGDDTLTGIAQRHLGRASRWTEIYEKNQDVLKDPENLTLGTVLRLPPDASSVELPDEAVRRR